MDVDLYDIPSEDELSTHGDERHVVSNSNAAEKDIKELEQSVELLRTKAADLATKLHSLLVRTRSEIGYRCDVLEAKKAAYLAKQRFVCSSCKAGKRPEGPVPSKVEVQWTTNRVILRFRNEEDSKEWLRQRGLLLNPDGLPVFLDQTPYAQMHTEKLSLKDVGSLLASD